MVRNWTYSVVLARKAFDLANKADAPLKGKIQPGPKFVEFDTARRDRLRLQKKADELSAKDCSTGVFFVTPRRPSNRGRGRGFARGRGTPRGRGKKRKRQQRKPKQAKPADPSQGPKQE